jgi:hypothetical protein
MGELLSEKDQDVDLTHQQFLGVQLPLFMLGTPLGLTQTSDKWLKGI